MSRCINWGSIFAAITTVKDTVEGLKEIDQYAELLIRLLSVLPGWNEKNIQVGESHNGLSSAVDARCQAMLLVYCR